MKQALQALIAEMEYVLSCINEDKIPFDGDDFHEALRLGKEALAQPSQEPVAWLSDDERKAFQRFYETWDDGEGYDVPKPMMKRLAQIGVIHHISRGLYDITKFGHSLLGYATSSHPPTPWTAKQIKEYAQQQCAQLPEAPL